MNHALFDLGANEADGVMPDEATWEANYEYIINAVLAKWPETTIYIAKVWSRDYAANTTTLNGWIDTILAYFAGKSVKVGHNESVWMEGGDNGATNATADGIHYSTAGETACAAQWQTVLGF